MNAVLTLTPNPALDLSARTGSVVPGHKLRCSDVERHAGGGGINVARMLHRLGVPVQAHYLGGGVAGSQLAGLLAQEGVPAHCQHIAGETRENLAVLDKASGQEYRFLMPGPELGTHEWQACLSSMDKLARGRPAPPWLVASGSLPPGVPDDFYARMARVALAAGVPMALDTSGPALALALEVGVALIKPSLSELRALVGLPLVERGAAIGAACALVQQGAARMVALSLGEDGAVLATQHGAWQAPALRVQAALGTTGAGDCFLAALLAALMQGTPPPEALRAGVAAGAASLLASGTGLASASDLGGMLPQVQVSPVSLP